jgi:hypothetical protein
MPSPTRITYFMVGYPEISLGNYPLYFNRKPATANR